MRVLVVVFMCAACTPSSKSTERPQASHVDVAPPSLGDASSNASSSVAASPSVPSTQFPSAPTRSATLVCRPTTPPKGFVEHNGPKGDPAYNLPGCQSDAECKKSSERCTTVRTHVRDTRPTNKCTDDACLRDADCPSGTICVCGTDELSHRNRCAPGNCESDADCGGFTCGESMVHALPAGYDSRGPSVGLVSGRYCRSARDTCQSHADCPGAKCTFQDSAFRCARVPIPRPG